MTLQKKIGFWLLAFAALVIFLTIFRDVLLPFVAGLILAYLLDPAVTWLARRKLGRLAATGIVLGFSLLLFVGLILLLIPLLGAQVSSFVERLPATINRLEELITTQGAPLLRQLNGSEVGQDLKSSMGELAGRAAGMVGNVLKSLVSGGQALLGILSLFVITPIVAFYLLVDWEKMIASVDSWVPLEHRETVWQLAKEMDQAISGFLRGQALVCLFLGTFYAIGLMSIGLNFGLLIGVSAGLISFIPFVGSLIGFLVSVGVAVAQFWPEWTWIVATASVFLLGQFIEGNILSPKLMGDQVGLHPVWLMFALLAAGSLFGFVGLLLAVPMAAVIGVLVRFALKQYLSSSLYLGAAKQVASDG